MRVRIISLGGFIDYQIQLVNALSGEADVMLAIFASGLADEHRAAVNDKVPICFISTRRPLLHPFNLIVLLKTFRMIRSFCPDVIHVQGGFYPWFAIFLPFLRKYPLVSTFHDPQIHYGEEGRSWTMPWRRFNRWCAAKFSKQILVHGEKLKEQLIAEFGVDRERVTAIQIGEHQVEPFKIYERDDLREDGNLVLFFGRIHPYKGLDYLIKAEPLITREIPDVKIVIAGSGEDFTRYRKMIGNRIEHFIIHNYHIPYQEGAELLQRSSVVVLPYIDASQSGVIPTAYGFRKPVVVTDVGSISEIVDDGETGFIVPPGDVDALSRAIIRLMKDAALRNQMAENAFRKLKTDLSWENISIRTMEVYRKAF